MRRQTDIVTFGSLLCLSLFCGCVRQETSTPVASRPSSPSAPVAPTATAAPAPPIYRPYSPLSLGTITKSFPPPIATFADGHREYQIDPRDQQNLPPGPLSPDAGPPVIAQGHVVLREFTLNIAEANATGTLLSGTVQVFNEGPYDVTDVQACLRVDGNLYILLPPQAGTPISPGNPALPIPPHAATNFRIRATVPFAFDPKKIQHTLYLEAQLNGPPGLVTDEHGPTMMSGSP